MNLYKSLVWMLALAVILLGLIACNKKTPDPTPDDDVDQTPPSDVEPDAPVDPENPVEPDAPVDPVDPEAPADPELPVIPVDPEIPAAPEVPTDPEVPVEPENPIEPETPVDPELPVEPETPTEPEPSVEPEIPADPEVPVIPGVSGGNTEPDVEDNEPDNTDPVDPEIPDAGQTLLTYEEYAALSGAEQRAYMESFSDEDAFFEWWLEAKAAYDAEHAAPEIGGDGNINIGDHIGGN